MKRFCFIVLMMCSIVVYAHKINEYKFIHIEETGNLYGVEDRLSEYFSKIGFQLVDSNEMEDMSNEDKALLLVVTYEWRIIVGAPSTLLVTFTDNSGTDIYKAAGQGNSFTAEGDMKKALKKVFERIDGLHYKFEPKSLKVQGAEDVEFSSWSEEQIEEYLDKNDIAPLEGIYKNYSNSVDYYNIAIL